MSDTHGRYMAELVAFMKPTAFTADKAFQQNLDLGSKRGWTLDRIVELNDRAFLMIWDRGIAGQAPDVAT